MRVVAAAATIMVLRKSEYRKNFKWFSSDKRNALWLENALYRAERRQREFVHEPLGDDDSGYEVGDSESEDCGLPPTKIRLRRLQLAALARGGIDDVGGGCDQPDDPARHSCDDRHRKAALDAPEVPDKPFLATSPVRHRTTQTTLPARRDVAVQTVPADVTRLPRIADDHRRRTRGRSRGNARKEPDRCGCCCGLWGAPFENYGWADDVDTIATKRTFNVAASTDEVHPSALAAMRMRQRPPSPPPIQRKTFRPERPHSAPPPKDRRLWISEYRDQYQ